jgi:predicted phosphodiesterase
MKALIIGDIHIPYERKGYLRFCAKVRDKYKCDKIICIGDEIDSSAVSFHAHDPEGLSVLDEWKLAKKRLAAWGREFGHVDVVSGNHQRRVARVAAGAGIPENFLKAMPDLYDLPKWKWALEYEYDGVTYTHGDGFGGTYPYANAAQRLGKSVVIGHCHSRAGIVWFANKQSIYFGMGVGCGVDDKAIAFRYCQNRLMRSMIGCGVVLDGLPVWIPMEI